MPTETRVLIWHTDPRGRGRGDFPPDLLKKSELPRRPCPHSAESRRGGNRRRVKNHSFLTRKVVFLYVYISTQEIVSPGRRRRLKGNFDGGSGASLSSSPFFLRSHPRILLAATPLPPSSLPPSVFPRDPLRKEGETRLAPAIDKDESNSTSLWSEINKYLIPKLKPS